MLCSLPRQFLTELELEVAETLGPGKHVDREGLLRRPPAPQMARKPPSEGGMIGLETLIELKFLHSS